ncbi:MAG: NAD(P)H-dependent oxidoreductase subunit E, partial [Thermomicrobiales bacterium]|nr:NAD(P)H-dependent oxidoreductase subunit E [Thermomicrobiales bacterium]MCO5221690.1 NAD(P)H-dependent oxidoreductase subunit E [Thermomicrobiales bacterium]
MAEVVHAPAKTDGIDLDYVRTLMAHFEPEDWQEGQELILSALQEINEHFGYVSVEAAEIVAERLGTTINRIYGLLTFYADFRTQPRGKHFMLMCHGMSCYVMGSQKLVQEMADKYGISDGGTTAGGELTIQVVNGCLGACNQSPVVKLDDDYHGRLTTESFNELVQRVIAETAQEQ